MKVDIGHQQWDMSNGQGIVCTESAQGCQRSPGTEALRYSNHCLTVESPYMCITLPVRHCEMDEESLNW